MEREACLGPVAPGGWMSGLKLAAARKPGPTQHRSSHIQALAPLGCAVSQVVKTAQSRGRTERTLLFAGALARRSTASPTPRRGRRNIPRTGLTRHFRCHITVCYSQLITTRSADVLPVVGGRCTGGAHRCKVKQGCREDRADVWILLPK